MAKNYYKILSVPQNATQADIKKSFRALAVKYHPDKAEGNEKRFKEVSEAYQVLSDEEKRKQYDLSLNERSSSHVTAQQESFLTRTWAGRTLLFALVLLAALIIGAEKTPRQSPEMLVGMPPALSASDTAASQQDATATASVGDSTSSAPSGGFVPVSVTSPTVRVAPLSNGQDGYSLTIPTGTASTCTWTWQNPNAQFPYSQTTYGTVSSQEHVITFPADTFATDYGFAVRCTDNLGNTYTGSFPQ